MKFPLKIPALGIPLGICIHSPPEWPDIGPVGGRKPLHAGSDPECRS